LSASRFALAAIVVIGVPAALVGYMVLAEFVLRPLKDRSRTRLRPWIWLLPGFALLGLYLLYPTITTLINSFQDANSSRWIGLENYRYLFTNAATRDALRNNVLWVVVFTGAVVLFGLLVAVLSDRVRYEALARGVVFIPMAVSLVAAGVIWRFMYDYRPPGLPQTGTVNAALTTLAPGFSPQPWLIRQPWNNLALIVAAVWIWTGFAAVILAAALKSIPAEVLEAARVDGAGEWQTFWRITLPMLAPTLAVVTTTVVITSLKAFDIVYVMTNGNYNTDVIANRMYKEMFNVRNFGHASAIAVILLLAIVPVMLFNLQRFRAQEATR
jgi:alpha-glucoside transport system permease protein